ncbi:uncharacterized protein LOC128602404 isoform X1 [Ictalurus furcatus]|uniref:uncharacterized protein LOC128602404 isoform X1 n=1 Tax=Ictalurus furcatus TaxID=66913 RepID=UPI0023506D43|nr:uncharacterized protein LOC128602404 isoform X1 [Ictalurus furcatus]
MVICTTSGGSKRKPRFRQTSSGTSSLLMTVPLTIAQKRTCNAALTGFLVPAQTSVSPSAPRRLRSCISQPREALYRVQHHCQWSETENSDQVHLGSTLSQNATIDDEVNVRIARASSAFGRLYAMVWNRRGITIQTELKVYRAVVLPTLLYACETWTGYQRHARKLNHFHTTSLRKILAIKWQNKVPDTVVLNQAGLLSIFTILMMTQLCWAGRVIRMTDQRLPKRLLYGKLQQGQRCQEGQKKRFKDTLNASMKAFNINPASWVTDCIGS